MYTKASSATTGVPCFTALSVQGPVLGVHEYGGEEEWDKKQT